MPGWRLCRLRSGSEAATLTLPPRDCAHRAGPASLASSLQADPRLPRPVQNLRSGLASPFAKNVLYDAFASFDPRRRGLVTAAQMRRVLAAFGLRVSIDEVLDLVAYYVGVAPSIEVLAVGFGVSPSAVADDTQQVLEPYETPLTSPSKSGVSGRLSDSERRIVHLTREVRAEDVVASLRRHQRKSQSKPAFSGA